MRGTDGSWSFTDRTYIHSSKMSKIDNMSKAYSVGNEMEEGRRKKDALLELPFSVIERTDVPCLEPPRDAVEVERVLFVASQGQM